MTLAKHTFDSVKLISALLLATCALLFVAGISYRQILSLTESGKEVVQSYQVNIELEQLNLYAREAESSQRAFLLTKDLRFRAAYRKAINDANESIKKLKLLTANNPKQSNNIDSLTNILDQRFVRLENVVLTHLFQIPTPDSIVAQIIEGSNLMFQSESLVRKIVDDELSQLSIHETAYKNDITFSPLTVYLIVVLSFFIFMIAFLKINTDLKRARKTNNLLLINKEVFEQSEQLLNVGHWSWDNGTDSFIFSRNLYDLLGCKADEFTPTADHILTFIHPEDKELVIQRSSDALKGIQPWSVTSRVIRKDGVLRYFMSTGKVITDDYGRTFVIGVTADISEQHGKDKIIEDKVADLEKSNKELLAFNHIASHDLQEPLRKVLTFISRIREKDFETLPEKVQGYMIGIERATARMGKFIEDLLMYSRANNVEKVFELTDLNVLFENSKQEFSQQIKDKKAVVKLLDTLPTLHVIPFQIQQLFNNVLSNSLKYSKPDTEPVILVSAKIIPSKELLSLPSGSYRKYYKISFSDNGIGFEQKYAENIFTIFYRLHNTSEYSGTGVGLAICKLIVDNHNGIIEAEGSPGKGATFSFYFPV